MSMPRARSSGFTSRGASLLVVILGVPVVETARGQGSGELVVEVPVVEAVLVDETVRPAQPGGDEERDEVIAILPFDPDDYPPMPLPRSRDRHAEEAPPRGPVRLVSKDLRTGAVTVQEVGGNPGGLPSSASSPGGRPTRSLLAPEGGGADFSPLTLVSNPEDFPFRVVCRLFMNFRDTGGAVHYSSCSGTLIDPKHVLTAGHCVYMHVTQDGAVINDYAESISVVPGYENGNMPYGGASAVSLHSFVGWTQGANFNDDVGLIELDRPIGALTGWFAYGYNDDCLHFMSGEFRASGYPGEPPFNGEYMYTFSGHFDNCENFLGGWFGGEVGITRRTYKGQSGSGAVVNAPPPVGRMVEAVLSNGSIVSTNFTRVQPAMFNSIRDRIDLRTPSQLDLIPLDVQVSPSAIEGGERLSALSFLVLNYSERGFVGSVSAGIYASVTSNIESSDTLLGTISFTPNLTFPRSVVRVNVPSPPRIPSTLAAGRYWIGVILDFDDDQPGNNDTDGQDAAVIQVQPLACSGRANLLSGGTLRPGLRPQIATGGLSTTGGVMYGVQVAEPGFATFSFCDAGAAADFDTYLCLYNDRFELLRDNDASCGSQAKLLWGLGPEPYNLVVSGAGNSSGQYSLVHFTQPLCNGQIAASLGTIQPAGTPATVTGVFLPPAFPIASGHAYDFEVTETGTYTFTFCRDGGLLNFDAALCLFDETGDLVASNADHCGSRPELVETLIPGYYRLGISGGAPVASPYTLSYSRIGACDGRALSRVGSIAPTVGVQTVSGTTTLDLGNYYEVQVNVEGSSLHTFSTCADLGAADYDTRLCLFDADWQPLAQDDETCAPQSTLVHALSSGTYYLAVSGFGDAHGSYTLAYFAAPTCNGVSVNSVEVITPLLSPQTAGGSVGVSSADGFTVRATSEGIYDFSLCGGGPLNTYLCLYDRSWRPLAENDDSCGLHASLTRRLNRGTYRLAVSGHTGQRIYQLVHSKKPLCGELPLADAGVLTPATAPQTVLGAVSPAGGNLYQVEVETAGEHTFTFCPPAGQAAWDTHLCLYQEGGQVIAENDDDAACGPQSAITSTLPAGTYYLGVSAGSSLAGPDAYVLAYYRKPQGLWIRCDHNCDGKSDLSDAIHGLGQLFSDPTSTPCCPQVALCNEDDRHDISDWIFLLNYQFLGIVATPRDPFPGCGGEGCEAHSTCN